MRFSNILGTIVSIAASVTATQVTWDIGYDDPNRKLESVSCSDGPNGLIKKYGWTTQGAIPRFPYIGGAEAVEGWNSKNCGTCWSATFKERTVFVLAIDHTGHGLNLGLGAMEDLTDGNAVFYGKVDAVVNQVPLQYCGL
ncbi:hypothetical protein OQA88_13641 [Cercophora sp. LCS_1]